MKNNKSAILLFLFVATIFIIISNIALEKKIRVLKDEKFISVSKTTHEETKLLIDEKRNATLALAISLTYNDTLINAIQTSSIEKINLDEFSLSLRKNSDFKNVWFQIITNKGDSFYRSWVNKRGDSLLGIRSDVANMLKKPEIMTTISVGRYDMSFRSMVPIFSKNKELLGIVEVITHFNSIAKKIVKKGNEPIVLVDKKYKKQFIYPFTQLFVGDYYVANLNANPKYMKFITAKTMKHFLEHTKEYHTNKEIDSLIILYRLPDINGNDMGYIVLFKPLSSIDMSEINAMKEKMLFYDLGLVLLLAFFIYYFIRRNYISKLSLKNMEMQKLNTHLSNLIKEQDSFLSLFNQGSSIIFKWNNDDRWSVAHVSNSVMEFLGHSKEEFLNGTISYSDCIHKDDLKKVEKEVSDAIKNDLSFFIHHPYRVVTKSGKIKWVIDQTITLKDENQNLINFIGFISDITDVKNLEKSNQEKEQMLFQQSKMASMGEMIGNIAHQWRQPIAIISMWANNIIADIDMEEIENENLRKYANNINEQTNHLSKTIDDFRNFFSPNKEKNSFTLKSSIDKTMFLLTASFKTHNIEMIEDIEDIEITALENELTQAILNIVKNAKDILITLPKESKKLLFINVYKKDNNAVIEIKDNGGGIPEDIIDKVFEPYFTTKHKSQGTGIGLYMTESIVTKHLDGEISVENVEYKHETIGYTGAKFIIRLPIK